MHAIDQAANRSCYDAAPCSRAVLVREKAVELFAAHGFGKVSMRDLASHVGVQAGSLYHYFDSKESLLAEMVEALYETLLANARLQLKRPGTNEEKLIALMQTHLNLHAQKPKYFHIAEHDLRYLEEAHTAHINAVRERYEGCYLKLLSPNDSATLRLKAAVHNMVSILNNTPNWLASTPLPVATLDTLCIKAALGAIDWARQKH